MINTDSMVKYEAFTLPQGFILIYFFQVAKNAAVEVVYIFESLTSLENIRGLKRAAKRL